MIHIAIKILDTIGNQSNFFTYKLVSAFGLSGIGVAAAGQTAINAGASNYQMIGVAGIVSIISGVLFIIQRAYAMYLDRKKDKRETEAHERQMNKEE